MCWSPVWEGVQLISSSWGFVLLLSEGAPLGLLMAFPLRGVELISLVSKICHYDFNCPSCTQKCWKQSRSFDLFIYLFCWCVFFSTRAAAAALTGWLNVCTLHRRTALLFAVKRAKVSISQLWINLLDIQWNCHFPHYLWSRIDFL